MGINVVKLAAKGIEIVGKTIDGVEKTCQLIRKADDAAYNPTTGLQTASAPATTDFTGILGDFSISERYDSAILTDDRRLTAAAIQFASTPLIDDVITIEGMGSFVIKSPGGDGIGAVYKLWIRPAKS
jgi:hypothetical protein